MPFQCPRCQNQDLNQVGIKLDAYYCRACIGFVDVPWVPQPRIPKPIELHIPYALTPEQLHIAYQLVRCYQRKQSAMVDAVTGSGKTELVYRLIQTAISEGKTVGFVIPRTDVVKEMAPRFTKVFPSLKITTVFGGHHDDLEGDIIILTTHQIFRYQQYFDVLIFDEVDAFPYQGNPVLAAFVNRASKGIIVYLSATFSKQTLQSFKASGGQVFHLFKRFHGVALPQIDVMIYPFFLKWILVVNYLITIKKKAQPVFVFVPTIQIGKWLHRWLKVFFSEIRFAYAASPTRDLDVEAFKLNHYQILITTSILERGITLANLQVILFAADHPLMSAATLVQMAGRVGRKNIAPTGKVMAFVDRHTAAIKEANDKINFANQHL